MQIELEELKMVKEQLEFYKNEVRLKERLQNLINKLKEEE